MYFLHTTQLSKFIPIGYDAYSQQHQWLVELR